MVVVQNDFTWRDSKRTEKRRDRKRLQQLFEESVPEGSNQRPDGEIRGTSSLVTSRSVRPGKDECSEQRSTRSVFALARPTFWGTHRGAELDLLVQPGTNGIA